MNILVKVRIRAAHQPLEERLHALDTNFYLWSEIPGEQVCLRGSSAARWAPYAAGWKAKVDVLAGVSVHFRLEPEKASKIKDRRSASPVQVGRREAVHRHVMHIRIVGRQFSKVLTPCGFSRYQQNQPNEKRFSHNHPLTSKDSSLGTAHIDGARAVKKLSRLTGVKNWENLQSNDLIPEQRTITHGYRVCQALGQSRER